MSKLFKINDRVVCEHPGRTSYLKYINQHGIVIHTKDDNIVVKLDSGKIVFFWEGHLELET